MPSSITFTGCFVRTVTLALDESAKKVRINCTANLTDKVRAVMGWGKPPHLQKDGEERSIEDAAQQIDLDGELHATNLSFRPSNAELRGVQFDLDIHSVSHFQLVTVNDGESKSHRELRFQILTSATGAATKLETYTDVVGQGKGELRVSYTKQEDLPLHAADEQREATSDDKD